MFADIKIIPTFASAITKKVLYKANEGRFSKRVFRWQNEEWKKSCKKFLKYLVVTKICFIFAPLSRPKMRCEISNGSLIYWLL